MTEFTDTALTDAFVPVAWSSFLIRCYREGETGSWRGEVLHLQSQDRRRIATLAQICDFLSQHTPGLQENKDISVLSANQ